MYDFKNKRGIIFGATGFIGQKLSYELSKLGCKLILHGRSIDKLSDLDDKIQKIKISQILVQGDLNNKIFYKDLAKDISTRFEKIDFLFILVGLFERLSPITHFSHEEWSKLIEININCYWRILKELEPIIKKSQSPRIVFISNSKISSGKPYHNILSISQAALKTIANLYKSENKRLGIDTRIIEIPNLEKGITSMTAGGRKLNKENFINKIIEKAFT
ncbi:MAG: hypothetical protein CMM98_04875 [Rickettsiales bacterium]|nr:hypothetical protein [Rickettsiales bacterium]|tara:strand:- start:377 stop:1033 length:657 start_codon:yes stop_codon:yes gene_type:complete